MEISIDLKLIREIVFKDEALLKEMLEEWITDSENKMEEIKKRWIDENFNGLFNKVHELKTNFSMIHSGEAIQFCEKLIAKIEKEHTISSSDLDDLNSIVQFARQKLKEIIS
jgi:HPt (histidine-containing phosphotransfer) domain-containing protein